MSGKSLEPIATYEDRRSGVRNRFDLFADAIRVCGSNGQTEVDATISLAPLDPSITRVWRYSHLSYFGIGVFLVGIVLLLIVVGIVMVMDIRSFPTKPMEFVGTFTAMGAVLIVLNRHKIKHAYFRTEAGVSILVIPNAVKGREEFDNFVELLVEQIHRTRNERHDDGH